MANLSLMALPCTSHTAMDSEHRVIIRVGCTEFSPYMNLDTDMEEVCTTKYTQALGTGMEVYIRAVLRTSITMGRGYRSINV